MQIWHDERYASWDEIRHARYALIPNDVMMYLSLPPRERYVDRHHSNLGLHGVEFGDYVPAPFRQELRGGLEDK